MSSPSALTSQLGAWTSGFGRAYTDRNTMSADAMDATFAARFGVPKTTIYRELVGVGRLTGGRALEVGCNIGLQLELLGRANPSLALAGVEPQEYAIARARQRLPTAQFLQGSAFALPFEDGSFDLVFTHGVLIHIHPADLPRALREIHRVSSRFILAHEYFAPETVEVRYREANDMLWKTDFARSYRDLFPALREVELRYYPYLDAGPASDLVDQVVLFEKPRQGAIR